MQFSRRTATLLGTVLGVLASGLLAMSSVSVAAPQQDSVVVSGTSTFCGGPLEITAQSGPNGENPTGQLSGACFFNGPVICLNVQATSIGPPGGVALLVVDSPTGAVALRIQAFARPFLRRVEGGTGTGCSQPQASYLDLGFSGTITLTDAPALPTSRDQCKHGGWAQYGFRNRGQCVRFVRLIPGPPPYPSTKEQCRHGGWAQFGFKTKRKCLRFVRLTPNP